MLGDTDYKAGLALLVFPVVYGGFLIRMSVASEPAPKLDPTGHPYPPLVGEVLGYVVVGSLIALLGHLLVFVPFRARHRGWPMRVLLPLQLIAAAGSLYTFKFAEPVAAVLVAPVVVTMAVYGLALLIARRNEQPLSS
jgi:hypothetical protein